MVYKLILEKKFNLENYNKNSSFKINSMNNTMMITGIKCQDGCYLQNCT